VERAPVVQFVGVDLAWTPNGGTGLCHVSRGRVLASTRVSTDAEILDWLAPRTAGDAVVAIDAPLVVRNPAGRRPCERLISRCFGVHHASAHSSNLGLPAFREGCRGERIACALALDVDPRIEPGAPVRRALEVYPHPAIVALFDLSVTLKYKARPRRTLPARAAALTALALHLERLADADPPLAVAGAPRWETLRRIAAAPSSGAELARAEDELDAYVCAYVGLYYWTHGTSRCRIVGDLETGYIVTPVNEAQARCLDAQSSDVPPCGMVTSRS
jgi:predicted RNase H-like nuclease